MGPHGCSSTCIVTKSSPKPILGATEGFHETSNFKKKLSRATKQPIQRENGLTGKGPHGGGGGGATGGTWSWDPGPPPWVRGSIYKRTVLQDPGPNTHTAATIPKVVLDPLPHPKKRYPGAGGYGGPNPKNHWGVIFGPKMMILQGVKR